MSLTLTPKMNSKSLSTMRKTSVSLHLTFLEEGDHIVEEEDDDDEENEED